MDFKDRAPIQVDDELIRITCRCLEDAMRMCVQVSGRGYKEVAWDCGWRDEGRMLKRILSVSLEGGDKRYMPSDKWIPFMVACKNVVPLRFLAMRVAEAFEQQGVASMDTPVSDELRVLRVMLGEIRDEMTALRESRQGGTAFSLAGPIGLPEWLICEADRVGLVGV